MTDRQYVRVPPDRARARSTRAHALVTWTRLPGVALALCGRLVGRSDAKVPPEVSDRLPPDWRLCGGCSRKLASDTDARSEPVAFV